MKVIMDTMLIKMSLIIFDDDGDVLKKIMIILVLMMMMMKTILHVFFKKGSSIDGCHVHSLIIQG